MKKIFGKCVVNQCTTPAFMGHEEIVLPMLVRGSKGSKRGKAKIGEFTLCTNDGFFELTDIANTAVGGNMAGIARPRVAVERIFVSDGPGDWLQVDEISLAVDRLGSRYAFFLEESAAPVHDGYVRRCRFVAPERLGDFYRDLDVNEATTQQSGAREVLSAFLDAGMCVDTVLSRLQVVYGSCLYTRAFRDRFGDDEQFSAGYAVWLEEEGIVRVWTRITYSPK